MPKKKVNLEREERRLAALARMDEESKAIRERGNWRKRFQPGSFGHHELLDRTSLVAEMVEDIVLDHPACILNPKWYAMADNATMILAELYQLVGAAGVGKQRKRTNRVLE